MTKRRLDYYGDTDKQEEVVDGEVIAEYSGTHLNLPGVDEDDVIFEPEDDLPDEGRRGFLGRLLLGGAAALTVGGGAALLVERHRRAREPQVIVLPNGSEVNETDVSDLYTRIAELEAQLVEMTAARDQLISDLSSSEANQTDVGSRLAGAEAQLAEYADLIALWKQLDDIGLDHLIEGALSSVGGVLAALLTLNGVLNTGLAAGQRAITGFLNLLPGPSDGVRWLQRQMSTLSDNLDWLALQVQEAVEPVEPFAQLIAEFVLWVLNRLPFGIGSRAEAGLDAMKSIINDLPGLIDGISQEVLDPLAVWLGDDDEENLSGILLNPVDENIVRPARSVMAKIGDFEETYQQDLVQPVETALADRAEIRSRIRAAEARLGLRV